MVIQDRVAAAFAASTDNFRSRERNIGISDREEEHDRLVHEDRSQEYKRDMKIRRDRLVDIVSEIGSSEEIRAISEARRNDTESSDNPQYAKVWARYTDYLDDTGWKKYTDRKRLVRLTDIEWKKHNIGLSTERYFASSKIAIGDKLSAAIEGEVKNGLPNGTSMWARVKLGTPSPSGFLYMFGNDLSDNYPPDEKVKVGGYGNFAISVYVGLSKPISMLVDVAIAVFPYDGNTAMISDVKLRVGTLFTNGMSSSNGVIKSIPGGGDNVAEVAGLISKLVLKNATASATTHFGTVVNHNSVALRYMASYSGNPDSKPIYPNFMDHGEGEPLSGGTDVMRRLQNNLLHEQGNDDQKRPESPKVAAANSVQDFIWYMDDNSIRFKNGPTGWWVPAHNMGIRLTNQGAIVVMQYQVLPNAMSGGSAITVSPMWVKHPKFTGSYQPTLALAQRVVGLMEREPTVTVTVKNELLAVNDTTISNIPQVMIAKLSMNSVKNAIFRWSTVKAKEILIQL